MLVEPERAFAVVGLLSLAYDSNVRCCPRRGSGSRGAARRQKIREMARPLLEAPGASVILRFVLAAEPPPEFVPNGAAAARTSLALATLREEEARERDLLFVNQSEGFFECARKYLLFYREALSLYPRAQYLVSGDDDAYIQFAHLEAELRSVPHAVGQLTLWGLVTWRPYYENVSMDTSGVGFMGWVAHDWPAVRLRLTIDECNAAFVRSVSSGASTPADFRRLMVGSARNASLAEAAFSAACAQLVVRSRRRERGREVLTDMDHTYQKAVDAIVSRAIDPSPPFPQINGPCFAVSRGLSRLLVEDPLPRRWLERLRTTELMRTSLERGGKVPTRMRSSACYPMSDSVLGYWVSAVARAQRQPLTLVDSPINVQHHPWPTYTTGVFSNRSIVLHNLKDPNSSVWEFAARRSAGPFEPIKKRVCRSCTAMGWATWPRRDRPEDDAASSWRCCGHPAKKSVLERECRSRDCGPRRPDAIAARQES